MTRKTAVLHLYVELDPTPGAFHDEASAAEYVGGILYNNIPHYNPQVSIAGDDCQVDDNDEEGNN